MNSTDSTLDLLESAAGEEDPGAGVEVLAPPTTVQPMMTGGVDECPECGGTGRLGDLECPECAGTGLVTADVSGV
ncbi:MAG: hypothetical protein ACAH21_10985 [Ramlibacter sp.]